MNRDKKLVMCAAHIAGRETIEYLLESGYRFDYFVIIKAEDAQRYKISGYYDYTPLAKRYDIPIYYPKSYNLKASEDIAFFQREAFDLLIQGGWQRLFPDEILQTLSIGAIGIHGSSEFLPRGRGRSPYNWSLIEGKKRFILHFFLIKPGIDDGDVFHFEQFEINEFDDINTMYYKGAIVTKKAYKNFLPKLLDGSIETFPQKGEASYYPKRTAKDGKIDFNTMDVDAIYNLIRAVTKPYPGAFAYIDNKRVTIWSATIFDRVITYPKSEYGEVVEVFEGKPLINALGGLLFIKEYECDGDIVVGDILV